MENKEVLKKLKDIPDNLKTDIETIKTDNEENKTSILSLNTKTDTTNNTLNTLKTKVNNGQNFKLTNDDGKSKLTSSSGANLNDYISSGNHTINAPINSPGSGWVELEVIACADQNNTIQRILIQSTQNMYYRYRRSGVWQPWREL